MMTMNPYTNPYILQSPQQDIGGLSPYFQNIGQQQAMQNAALAQQNQQVAEAGQTGGSGAGASQLAMAALLRNQDPNKKGLGSTISQYANSIPAILKYGASNVYGGFGQGQVPTTTTGMD